MLNHLNSFESESNCHKCHNCNNYVTKWIAPSHRIAQWISPSTKEVLQSLKIQSESKRHFHRNFDFKQISSSFCWNCLNLDHSADRYSSVKNRRGSCTSMLPSFSQDWSDLMIRRCQVATIEANKCNVNCQTIMRIYLYTWSEYYRSKLLLSIWPKGVTPLVFKPCQGGHRHSWSKKRWTQNPAPQNKQKKDVRTQFEHCNLVNIVRPGRGDHSRERTLWATHCTEML